MGGDWRWGRSGQYPVARITPDSVYVPLVRWASTTFISKLPHILMCSVSPNCFLEGGRWKGSSLFYIYVSAGRDRPSWLFLGWSVQRKDGFSECEMPFSPYRVLLCTGPWQRQHFHPHLPQLPQLPLLSLVLLLMRSCSAEADPPLLLCK